MNERIGPIEASNPLIWLGLRCCVCAEPFAAAQFVTYATEPLPKSLGEVEGTLSALAMLAHWDCVHDER